MVVARRTSHSEPHSNFGRALGGATMIVTLRISRNLWAEVHEHLTQAHKFAPERVGFLACAAATAPDNQLLLFAESFHPVNDENYIQDPSVGARIDSAAIRSALQIAYNRPVSMLHVHRHEHDGRPLFSGVDMETNSCLVPNFWHVQRCRPHGAIVLSRNSANGLCWIPSRQKPVAIGSVMVVGRPILLLR